MKERILWLVLLALSFAAGRLVSPIKAHSYTFQHRPDGIYRYDEIHGGVEVLLPDKIGWQRIVTSSATKAN